MEGGEGRGALEAPSKLLHPSTGERSAGASIPQPAPRTSREGGPLLLALHRAPRARPTQHRRKARGPRRGAFHQKRRGSDYGGGLPPPAGVCWVVCKRGAAAKRDPVSSFCDRSPFPGSAPQARRRATAGIASGRAAIYAPPARSSIQYFATPVNQVVVGFCVFFLRCRSRPRRKGDTT